MLSYVAPVSFTGYVDNASTLHDVVRYIPCNRRTLTALRCVSKAFRCTLQSCDSAWAERDDAFVSRHGQCVVFNAHMDERGRSRFAITSVSPVGSKFRTQSALVLCRYSALIASGLTRLTLHHALVDNNLFVPLAAVRSLRTLELVSCRAITNIGGASCIASLEHLEVMLCPLTADGAAGLRLPRLRCLRLRSCHQLQTLNTIASETGKRLAELRVENCRVDDAGAKVFFASLTHHLRILDLSCTQVDVAVAHIRPDVIRHVRELHLSSAHTSHATMRAMAPYMQHKLTSLFCEHCTNMTSFDFLDNLHALRFVDVSGHHCLQDATSLQQCANLELFRMAKTQPHDLSFVVHKSSLRVLDAHEAVIMNEMLMALRDLPALDTIVLSDCTAVSDINILHTCPKLRRIFCKKTSVNDAGIAALAMCSALEELDLQSTQVDDVAFLVSCTALRTLNLCDTIATLATLQQLSQKPMLNVICNMSDDSFDA